MISETPISPSSAQNANPTCRLASVLILTSDTMTPTMNISAMAQGSSRNAQRNAVRMELRTVRPKRRRHSTQPIRRKRAMGNITIRASVNSPSQRIFEFHSACTESSTDILLSMPARERERNGVNKLSTSSTSPASVAARVLSIVCGLHVWITSLQRSQLAYSPLRSSRL